MPDFFISFLVFPDWVNKFRTSRENIFGRIVKIEFCVCRELLWVSKNVNVIIRNGQNPENKVYILRQWFFFVIFYGGKCCSLLLLVFVSSDFSTESEFFYQFTAA